MTAGDLVALEYVGTCGCPTPACRGNAHVVDIGLMRLVVHDLCGAHRGFTGWSLERIQAEYASHYDWWIRPADKPMPPLSKGDEDE